MYSVVSLFSLNFFCLDSKHVMISYQWDVQKSMIQLKTQLQAQGYKVWMDIDEMGGSTLESMARAVENASVVLVCVSQKYKESPNCRSGNIAFDYQPPSHHHLREFFRRCFFIIECQPLFQISVECDRFQQIAKGSQ